MTKSCRTCKHIEIGRSENKCTRHMALWGFFIPVSDSELDTEYCDRWEPREADQ